MRIEVSFPELDVILSKMGIKKLVRDEHTPIWETIDTKLREEGIESPTLDDIETASDGTLSYKGRRILVYIRDQDISYGYRKFHIANCGALQDMQNKGLYKHRYVRATREDGRFIVNIMRFGEIIERSKLVELLVCRKCLSCLQYKGFSYDLSEKVKQQMVREFSLEEFFDIYD